MMTMVKGSLTATQNNMAMEQGYKYKVKGDYKKSSRIDPWSGMPVVTYNTHLFTNREEAEAYAKTQKWVFNKNITADVEELKHEETIEELAEKREAEKRAKAERKAKREQAKADEMGMTIEQYKEYKRIQSDKKWYVKEIDRMKAEIRKMEEEIKRMEEFIQTH